MTRLVALLLLLLAACGDEHPKPKGETRTIKDPFGDEVVVPKDPKRIVSTLPGITETVAYLGGLSKLVAVSPHCDYPPEVKKLPKVSVMPLSFEAIAAHDPDLVIVDSTLLRTQLPDLRRRFGAVLVLDSRSLAGVSRSFASVAAALGTETAQRKASEFARALVAARVSAATWDESNVLLIGSAEPLYVLGPGSLLDDVITSSGGKNVASDLGRASASFPTELVRARAPDWILVTGGGSLPAALLELWKDVPAVRNGHVADASADDLVRAGPRIPQGIERLARVLRGELPPEKLTERK